MDTNQLRKEILKLKEQKGAVILAHNYQIPDIQDIADELGDSLELSKISMKRPENTIVFCGVTFMAETAKILSPQKKVLLPVLDAGCPLADTINPEQLKELKANHPNAWVVSYVNSSAEIKALSDVCCTSANAINVVKNIPVKKIIFVPDKNFGWWVQKNVPEKDLILWEGFCYVHEQFRPAVVDAARKNHPDAKIMVHPECQAEILEKSDYVVSTSGMLKVPKEDPAKRFIVGTEMGMIYRLRKENPDREFYSLGTAKSCMNMKKTTLTELHNSLKEDKYEITLSDEIMRKSRKALEEMVKYV